MIGAQGANPMNRVPALFALAGTAISAPLALAQPRQLFADRGNNVIWLIDDLDSNGVIDEPAEIWAYFDATNAQGTVNVDNPSCMAVRADGLVAIGDTVRQGVYLLRDLNHDGDCQDVGESILPAGPGKASGNCPASPSGVAFDQDGLRYVTTAGTTAGADAIYRLVDLDGNGDFQGLNEIQPWATTGAFGSTPNGPYSPQEITFREAALAPIGFLRNS